MGGIFTTIGGQTRHYIARLDGTTGLADSFDPNANHMLSIRSRCRRWQDFGGRSFHAVSAANVAAFFARLANDTAALQDLAVTQTTITWTRGGSSPQFTRVTFEYSTDNVNYIPLGNGTADWQQLES